MEDFLLGLILWYAIASCRKLNNRQDGHIPHRNLYYSALKSFQFRPFFAVIRPRNVSNWVRAALGGIRVLTPWNRDVIRRCASTVLDWEFLRTIHRRCNTSQKSPIIIRAVEIWRICRVQRVRGAIAQNLAAIDQ